MASKEEPGAHRIRKWFNFEQIACLYTHLPSTFKDPRRARLCTFYRCFIHEGVPCGYHGECSEEPQMDV
jgi:hypothetical protein